MNWSNSWMMKEERAMGKYRIQPTGVGFCFGKGHSPLSTISTNRVFPLRLDFILETIEVSSLSQLAWSMYVVVKTAFRSTFKDIIKQNV